MVQIQGRIQDFKLGGAHLKKIQRAEGGAKIFGVFRVKNINLIFRKLILIYDIFTFQNFRFISSVRHKHRYWFVSRHISSFTGIKLMFVTLVTYIPTWRTPKMGIEGHMNRFEYCHPDNNSDNDSFGSFSYLLQHNSVLIFILWRSVRKSTIILTQKLILRRFSLNRFHLTFHISLQEYKLSEGEEEDDENEGTDIKDLEFRLSHDLNKLQVFHRYKRSRVCELSWLEFPVESNFYRSPELRCV
jgi:hypothetical protein